MLLHRQLIVALGLSSLFLFLATSSDDPVSRIAMTAKAFPAGQSQSKQFKFNSEYGLWVEAGSGQINVHWLTTKPDSGILEVYDGDILLNKFVTPLSQSHKVSFESSSKGPLRLRYGAQSGAENHHETLIYLEPSVPKSTFKGVDSVYVLGDIHGEFENLIELLGNAKIIDSEFNWIGNKKHLVALGDIFDRGADVTRTLWFLYELERQADRVGGKVHVLLGNHEIMTFCNDLRYLSAKERMIAQLYSTNYSNMYNVQRSILGKWLATKPGIIRINKILFAHGGVTPVYNGYTVQSFNNTLRTFLQEEIFQYLLTDSAITNGVDSLKYSNRLRFFFAENSLFWHRGYVLADTLHSELKDVLKHFKSNTHVVAHTAVHTIRDFYEGRVVAVDLVKPATELLLMVRANSNEMKKYKLDLTGTLTPL